MTSPAEAIEFLDMTEWPQVPWYTLSLNFLTTSRKPFKAVQLKADQSRYTATFTMGNVCNGHKGAENAQMVSIQQSETALEPSAQAVTISFAIDC